MTDNNHLQSRDAQAAPVHAATVHAATVHDESQPNFKTQRQHILDLLIAAEGGEVPLADIMVCAAQYNACIHALRKRGYKIVNRAETRNGIKHSWYRLESSPPELLTPSPRNKSARATPAPPLSSASVATSSIPQPAQTLSLFPDLAETSAPAVSSQRSVWRDPEMGAVKKGRVKHG